MLTVVKVGGGLGRGAGDDALRALCRTLGALGERHPLLVVPGGAGFAEAVRDADRRFSLGAATAHRMAILGMEQFGWVLSELIPRAVRCPDLARARGLAGGRTAVLLPAGLPLDALPASWQVTSDSIAAWVADQVGAERLVLVKDVDGLFADWPCGGNPLARLSVAGLADLRAAGRARGVDEHLPVALEGARFETWVIGGRDPGRVVELLDRGTTLGTRIVPAVPSRHG
jgi:5-(aminomethyl)-3-furanmethanol phosphate kinase